MNEPISTYGFLWSISKISIIYVEKKSSKKSLRAFLFEKCYGYIIIYIHISQHTLVYDKTNWIYPISVLIWQAFFTFNEIDSKLNKKWKKFTENLKCMQTCLCFRTEQKKEFWTQFYSIQICEVNISSCIVS